MLDGLRAALNAVGLTPFDIQLPDEDSAVAPLEGTLRVYLAAVFPLLRADVAGTGFEPV
jgi:hypothetical protein